MGGARKVGRILGAAMAALFLGSAGCIDLSPGGKTTLDIGLNNPNVIIAFGDSISDGYDSRDGMGYRSKLEALFAAGGNPAMRVLDEGEPGTRAYDGVARIHETLERDDPAVMILLYGMNDQHDGLPQSVFRAALATTSDNLRYMIDAARARKTIVVVSTIPPVCGPSRQFQRVNIESMNKRIQAIAASYQAQDDGVLFADVWEAFLSVAPPDGCSLINPDPGNHPNDAGYSVLARTYYEALQEVEW